MYDQYIMFYMLLQYFSEIFCQKSFLAPDRAAHTKLSIQQKSATNGLFASDMLFITKMQFLKNALSNSLKALLRIAKQRPKKSAVCIDDA